MPCRLSQVVWVFAQGTQSLGEAIDLLLGGFGLLLGGFFRQGN
jgi:hypothetical protein